MESSLPSVLAFPLIHDIRVIRGSTLNAFAGERFNAAKALSP